MGNWSVSELLLNWSEDIFDLIVDNIIPNIKRISIVSRKNNVDLPKDSIFKR